jgi:hypothetical protein
MLCIILYGTKLKIILKNTKVIIIEKILPCMWQYNIEYYTSNTIKCRRKIYLLFCTIFIKKKILVYIAYFYFSISHDNLNYNVYLYNHNIKKLLHLLNLPFTPLNTKHFFIIILYIFIIIRGIDSPVM